jgi:hypothetical protein
MKKFLILLVMIQAIIACDLDDTNEDAVTEPPEANESNVLRANVGDQMFESIDFNTSGTFLNENTLNLTGGNGVSTFTFEIKDFQGVGLYDILAPESEVGVEASYTITGTNGAPNRIWAAVIDENDLDEIIVTTVTESSIAGTFSYTAENPGGTFTIDLN